MRLAILLLLVCVVIVAPLIGVYALSPFFFIWGHDGSVTFGNGRSLASIVVATTHANLLQSREQQ